MTNINKIITEAINNQLLFNTLKTYGTNLANYANRLTNINKGGGNAPEIMFFLNELKNFALNLSNAIARCVNKNNLNEAYYGNTFGIGMSDVPLINNAYLGFMRGVKDDMFSNFRRNNGKNDKYANNFNSSNGSSINIPNNAKLSVLLTQYYPLIHQKYMKLDRKYQGAISNMNPPLPKYIINEVENVIRVVNQAQRI